MASTTMSASNNIYRGLDRSDRVKSTVLVKQRGSGTWFRFSLWEDRGFIVGRAEEYRDFEDYLNAVHENDVDELRQEYLGLFKAPAPDRANHKQLAEAIWCKRYAIAEDRTTTYSLQEKDHKTGKRKRKRSLDGRQYSLNPNIDPKSLPHLTPQARTCLRLFCKALTDGQKTTMTEAEVKKMMQDAVADGLLRTQQDPFRIWQYYRPTLVKEGILRHD